MARTRAAIQAAQRNGMAERRQQVAALVGALDERDWRPRVAIGRQREDC